MGYFYSSRRLNAQIPASTNPIQYFRKFEQKSLTSFDFKDTLLEFFAPDTEASAALATVDWDEKFYAPGLPPKPDFDTTLVDVCYALAQCWESIDITQFEPKVSDVADWSSGQLVVFLEAITDLKKPLSKTAVEKMKSTYKFLESENAEILSRFLTVGLKAKDEQMYAAAADALGQWGRMKFVRPLYRLLNECDRDLAVATFQRHENFYHPICR